MHEIDEYMRAMRLEPHISEVGNFNYFSKTCSAYALDYIKTNALT